MQTYGFLPVIHGAPYEIILVLRIDGFYFHLESIYELALSTRSLYGHTCLQAVCEVNLLHEHITAVISSINLSAPVSPVHCAAATGLASSAVSSSAKD